MLGHGAGIGYTGPRMGPIDNFNQVTVSTPMKTTFHMGAKVSIPS